MNASLKPFHLALLSGLVPIVAVHLAWVLNVFSGDAPACFAYWDGCVSVSRAARSGPGLHLFRALVLPTTVVMAATWLLAARWLRHYGDPGERVRRVIAFLGVTGAAFRTDAWSARSVRDAAGCVRGSGDSASCARRPTRASS